MAAQLELLPAVAATDDNISSPAVAAESSASGSGEWGIKVECATFEDTVTVCSVNTNMSEYQLVRTILPNYMYARSQASPLPGGTSEPKETTAEPIAAESELSASVGKAAGASSAVAEMAPPAVEDSSPAPGFPSPAPGSAAKAPPPEPPNEFWRGYIPVENPWPASEAMIPPQNCKAPHIPPVVGLEESLRRSTGS